MPADEPGPLPHGLLDRLATRPEHGPADSGLPDPGLPDPGLPDSALPDSGLLAADLAVLRDGGYLKLALPTRFGGAGLNLAELACAQRQLAARAPVTARSVNAHHAWVGAAADALASGAEDAGPAWVLAEAAQGRMFAGYGPAGLDAPVLPPGWDWLAVRHVDTHEAGRPVVGYGLAGRAGAGGFRTVGGDTLIAGLYAWGLALGGMTSYAIARRAFGLAVERAGKKAGEQAGRRGEHGRHPLDRWPVAEAALRLDTMRGQLDEVIEGWRQRVTAGSGLTSLDPGRLSLIQQFTARYEAGHGAVQVIELARLIAGNAVPAGRA